MNPYRAPFTVVIDQPNGKRAFRDIPSMEQVRSMVSFASDMGYPVLVKDADGLKVAK